MLQEVGGGAQVAAQQQAHHLSVRVLRGQHQRHACRVVRHAQLQAGGHECGQPLPGRLVHDALVQGQLAAGGVAHHRISQRLPARLHQPGEVGRAERHAHVQQRQQAPRVLPHHRQRLRVADGGLPDGGPPLHRAAPLLGRCLDARQGRQLTQEVGGGRLGRRHDDATTHAGQVGRARSHQRLQHDRAVALGRLGQRVQHRARIDALGRLPGQRLAGGHAAQLDQVGQGGVDGVGAGRGRGGRAGTRTSAHRTAQQQRLVVGGQLSRATRLARCRAHR
mmetsp:Transcript_17611/g.44328  ORF Transcript_17611/g.44328 Transcript_17611/m.44328 type:complete len:278 (+) Transcript_17611:1630-2463(+)